MQQFADSFMSSAAPAYAPVPQLKNMLAAAQMLLNI
jgi:hypothetical protein